MVFEPRATAAFAEQIQEQKNMSDERAPTAPRRPGKAVQRGNPPAEAPLDRERAAAELKRFTDLVIREMQLDIEYDIAPMTAEADGARPEEGLVVALRGADEALLLERNAELLLALEHLAHRWLRLGPQLHDRVRFDCGEYRATRLEELKLSARVAAQRVRETGQEFRFNPMSSRERRIVHLELNGAPGVRTASEGFGDRRQLVIYPVTGKKERI
jgi:spoIIIJ-associated protein